MSLEFKRYVIAGLGALFLVSLVFVQWSTMPGLACS